MNIFVKDSIQRTSKVFCLREYSFCACDSFHLDILFSNVQFSLNFCLVQSNASEKTLLDRENSVDSQDDPFIWNRQNSVSVHFFTSTLNVKAKDWGWKLVAEPFL